ncbi:hypothetical protein BJV74DRAFT_467049 [Russula compacta]|nr:hypothetical protein BJV74DRAFT_467049 [Russula compacta]
MRVRLSPTIYHDHHSFLSSTTTSQIARFHRAKFSPEKKKYSRYTVPVVVWTTNAMALAFRLPWAFPAHMAKGTITLQYFLGKAERIAAIHTCASSRVPPCSPRWPSTLATLPHSLNHLPMESYLHPPHPNLPAQLGQAPFPTISGRHLL